MHEEAPGGLLWGPAEDTLGRKRSKKRLPGASPGAPGGHFLSKKRHKEAPGSLFGSPPEDTLGRKRGTKRLQGASSGASRRTLWVEKETPGGSLRALPDTRLTQYRSRTIDHHEGYLHRDLFFDQLGMTGNHEKTRQIHLPIGFSQN